MTSQHDTSTGTIIDSIVLISSSWAHVLFDDGESYSFISVLFVNMHGLDFETLDLVTSVGVPLGKDCDLSFGYSLVHIEIGGQ